VFTVLFLHDAQVPDEWKSLARHPNHLPDHPTLGQRPQQAGQITQGEPLAAAVNITFGSGSAEPRIRITSPTPTRTFMRPLDFFFLLTDSFITYLENYLLCLEYFLTWIYATMSFFLYKFFQVFDNI
jgi:hypothetical protein